MEWSPVVLRRQHLPAEPITVLNSLDIRARDAFHDSITEAGCLKTARLVCHKLRDIVDASLRRFTLKLSISSWDTCKQRWHLLSTRWPRVEELDIQLSDVDKTVCTAMLRWLVDQIPPELRARIRALRINTIGYDATPRDFVQLIPKLAARLPGLQSLELEQTDKICRRGPQMAGIQEEGQDDEEDDRLIVFDIVTANASVDYSAFFNALATSNPKLESLSLPWWVDIAGVTALAGSLRRLQLGALDTTPPTHGPVTYYPLANPLPDTCRAIAQLHQLRELRIVNVPPQYGIDPGAVLQELLDSLSPCIECLTLGKIACAADISLDLRFSSGPRLQSVSSRGGSIMDLGHAAHGLLLPFGATKRQPDASLSHKLRYLKVEGLTVTTSWDDPWTFTRLPELSAGCARVEFESMTAIHLHNAEIGPANPGAAGAGAAEAGPAHAEPVGAPGQEAAGPGAEEPAPVAAGIAEAHPVAPPGPGAMGPAAVEPEVVTDVAVGAGPAAPGGAGPGPAEGPQRVGAAGPETVAEPVPTPTTPTTADCVLDAVDILGLPKCLTFKGSKVGEILLQLRRDPKEAALASLAGVRAAAEAAGEGWQGLTAAAAGSDGAPAGQPGTDDGAALMPWGVAEADGTAAGVALPEAENDGGVASPPPGALSALAKVDAHGVLQAAVELARTWAQQDADEGQEQDTGWSGWAEEGDGDDDVTNGEQPAAAAAAAASADAAEAAAATAVVDAAAAAADAAKAEADGYHGVVCLYGPMMDPAEEPLAALGWFNRLDDVLRTWLREHPGLAGMNVTAVPRTYVALPEEGSQLGKQMLLVKCITPEAAVELPERLVAGLGLDGSVEGSLWAVVLPFGAAREALTSMLQPVVQKLWDGSAGCQQLLSLRERVAKLVSLMADIDDRTVHAWENPL